MERRMRYLWWGILGILVLIAGWKFFLPHGATASVEKASSNREIVVYVSGAVEKAGLVHLPLDARLNDALKEAKPLPEANLDLMNPAEKLKDGQKITVPVKPRVNPEMNPGVLGTNGTTVQQVPGASNASVSATLPAQSTQQGSMTLPTSQNSSNGKININTAGAAELDRLPGIGPAFAERIIQYRTENGPFSKPEDLQNVSGIGAKTYEKMASMVTTGP